MHRIRLAYITHGLSANGIEKLMVNVAQEIDRSKFDVTFIVAIDSDMPTLLYEPDVLSLGIRVLRICDLDSWRKKCRYFREMSHVFAREKFDIVHTHMDLLNGIVLLLAKKAGVPKRISHAHTTNTQYISKDDPLRKKTVHRIYSCAMRFLIRHTATDRLGCSASANNYLHGKKPAVTLMNGIDVRAFALAKESSDTGCCLREANVHLVTVGRITMVKNPLFLCAIIKELSILRQDFVLHWVGCGEMFEAVQQEIHNLELEPYVQMLGLRQDIPQILCGCDLFLLPSLFEGLSVALIEAQASGLTCFVSDKVARECNAGGCRFLSLDLGAEAWAKEIDSVLCSMNDRPIADPERLLEYDIQNMAKRLEQIYAE